MQPKSSTTPGAPVNPLRSIACELQEERNLGVETGTIHQGAALQLEDERPGCAVAVVCGLVMLIILLGIVVAAVQIIQFFGKY